MSGWGKGGGGKVNTTSFSIPSLTVIEVVYMYIHGVGDKVTSVQPLGQKWSLQRVLVFIVTSELISLEYSVDYNHHIQVTLKQATSV